MFIKILLFVLSVLPVVIGLKLYDLYRYRWEKSFINSERERLSKIWHAIGYWTVLTQVVVIALHYFSILQILQYGPLSAVIVWWVYDLGFAIFSDQEDILYPGNGKGSFLELAYSFLGEKVGWDTRFWAFYIKFLSFLGALILAFTHNL